MIFSDIYTVKEVYSVLRQEHLYTSSSMPWLYTSLKDVKYQPALSDSIHNKLNEVFVYSYAVTEREHPIRNEYKHLTVNHNGDDHVSYESTVELHYNDLYGQGRAGHFIRETNTEYLQNAYDRATELLLYTVGIQKLTRNVMQSLYFLGSYMMSLVLLLLLK